MKWKKKGLIYCPSGQNYWAKTHAMLPTPELINDNVIRIYISSCDENTVGRIGYIDLDASNPSKILKISNKPLLDIGAPGTFDDNGVHASSIINCNNNKKLMYYIGFQLGVKVRYYIFTGLAISKDKGKTFNRFSKVPILNRSDAGLFFRTAPYVLRDEGIWKMWYIEGNKWINIGGISKPIYLLKYNESKDGINWSKEGEICLNLKNEDEHGFGRPFVIKENDVYKMLYSIRSRSKGYRLGYAESENGKDWIRKDSEVGINVSSSGWDSEMICFSSLLKVHDRIYMFYNGNNYGESGFGYALLERW